MNYQNLKTSVCILLLGGAAHSQTITNGVFTGNLKLQPNTTSTPQQPGSLTLSGVLDIYGNILNFGSAGSTTNPGVVLNYTDDATGTASTLATSSYRNSLSWRWQQNSAGGQKSKMLLDQNNKLSLFDLGGTSKIALDPIAGQITVNGQVLMSPNSFGNVGIATTSPTHSLTLGSTNTGISFYRTADQTTNYERLLMGWSGTTFGINTQTAGTGVARSLSLGVSGSNTININSGLPKLALSAGSNSAGNAITAGGAFTQSTGVANIFAITPTINQTSSAGYTALLVSPTETTVGTGTKNLADFQMGGVSKVAITNSGKVGIGTSTPNTPLDVYGDIRTSTGINDYVAVRIDNGAPTIKSNMNSGASLTFDVNGQMFTSWDSNAFGGNAYSNITFSTTTGRPIGMQSDNSLTFFTGDQTSPKLAIEVNGNVGIGTSSPTEKLDVAGNIKATGIITCAPGGDIPMYSGN